MAQFTVNAQRFDPYKNFKFRVKWDGRYVAGVSKVGALKRTTEVVEHREGGDPSSSRKSPGPHRVRGDHARARRHPRHRVRAVGEQGLELRLRASARRSRCKDFRKDIIIEVYNEAGQLVLAYKVYRCWVSEFQALPDLDANANAVAIQHIKLENEGWERDYEVAEPSEPHVLRAVDAALADAAGLAARGPGRTRLRLPMPERALRLAAVADEQAALDDVTRWTVRRREPRCFDVRLRPSARARRRTGAVPACGEPLELRLRPAAAVAARPRADDERLGQLRVGDVAITGGCRQRRPRGCRRGGR